MEKIRLRYQEAEKVIAQAREQALTRERESAVLRAKNQIPPPEASILGCWQIIEKTLSYNGNPDQVTGLTLGDCRIYFGALTPDNQIVGRFIASGGIRLTGVLANKAFNGTLAYDLNGRVLKEGSIQYRLMPQRRGFKGLLRGGLFMTWIFSLEVTAEWHGWELEGTACNKSQHFEEEFKAVRIDDES